MVRMAQEWKGSSGRRRCLESTMKDTQARTKVVLRHLPPTLSPAAFQEQIASKYAGSYTWIAFHQGKSSHKRQVHARAYINFKKPEDVLDFYDDFDGHVFVNERGTQYKAVVEYAPYQRVPKPRSKKDIREGTIAKDPDYLAFLEQSGKPTEFLPSAEVQLERREAEKAASLAAGGTKDLVIVTPLMEFIRQRRAAKSAPQRSMATGAKLAARAGGVASTFNLSQKRSSDKTRAGTVTFVSDKAMLNKEASTHGSGPPREEQQRREREMLIERKRKESIEGKEKKLVRQAVVAAVSSVKGNPGHPPVELSKDRTMISSKDSIETSIGSEGGTLQIVTADTEQSGSRVLLSGKGPSAAAGSGDTVSIGDAREASKRESRRKQVSIAKDKNKESFAEVGQLISPVSNSSVSSVGGSNQRHRSPASSKVTSGTVQPQQVVVSYRATSPGETESITSTGKQNHRRESGGRPSPRGGSSPKDHHSQPASQQLTAPASAKVELPMQTQQSLIQSERGGRRPPRPQSIRLASKDQPLSLLLPAPSLSEADSGLLQSNVSGAPVHAEEKSSTLSASDGFPTGSLSDRQDSRRVRNKDRPDRPVWTPRRRSDSVVGSDVVPSSIAMVPTTAPVTSSELVPPTSLQPEVEVASKTDKGDRGSHQRHGGRSGSDSQGAESPHGSGTGSGAGLSSTTAGRARSGEAGSRSSRGVRGSTLGVLSVPERQVVHHGDIKKDGVINDVKVQGERLTSENGEVQRQVTPSAVEKDRKKQEASSFWNEVPGGSYKPGSRRDRNGQQGLKDSEGGGTVIDLASKPAKRGGGPLALGSNEKQVWVAVQKSVTGP